MTQEQIRYSEVEFSDENGKKWTKHVPESEANTDPKYKKVDPLVLYTKIGKDYYPIYIAL